MLKLTPEAKAGITVVLSLVLLTTMVMAVERLNFGRKDSFEINVMYHTIDGLREGAPVRYAGVNVGTVAAIQLVDNGVLVKIQFDREVLIPADSQFAIKNMGILGDKYIEIQPGTAQQPLDAALTIKGTEPVVIDNLLAGVETTLLNLNQAVARIAEIASSDDLQNDVVEAGKLLKDTVAGLKTTVDQVSLVAVNVQAVVEDIGTVSQQLPELDLRSTFTDIQKFANELGNLNLQEPVNEINQFVAQLNKIPLVEVADDVSRIAQGLADIDFTMLKDDLYKFSHMLAATDLQPIVTEILNVTDEIKGLNLAGWGEDISRFTAQLDEISLAQMANDLQILTGNLAQIPIGEISANLYTLSNELALAPISEMVADLKEITQAVKGFGWDDLADNIALFTNQLSDFDIQKLFAGISGDLKKFSNNLAQMELDVLLLGVSNVVEGLENITAVVDPESLGHIMADLEGITGNVNMATKEINIMVADLNKNVARFSEESFVAVDDIKTIVAGVEHTVSGIDLFVEDLIAQGATAGQVKSTIDNIQDGTKELTNILKLVTETLTAESGPIAEVQTALTSIQKLNEDIENLRTMGEKVDVKSVWGGNVGFSLDEEGKMQPSRTAHVEFEFWPLGSQSFLLIGMRDILGNNHLQLQYGRQTGIFRQRYGIIDTSLGIGIDSLVSDKLGLTAELSQITSLGESPSISLRGTYFWNTDWSVNLSMDDFALFKGEPTFSVGVERRF